MPLSTRGTQKCFTIQSTCQLHDAAHAFQAIFFVAFVISRKYDFIPWPCTAHLRGLEFDKEGKVTSKKYGKAWCCTDLPGDGSSDVLGVEVDCWVQP